MTVFDYLLDNLLPILIAIGGMVAWFFDKRKRMEELQSIKVINKQTEATAMQGMQDVYDKFVSDVKLQLDELRSENQFLRERILTLENDLQIVNEERTKLIESVARFKQQSEIDSKLIQQLKSKLEQYAKELRSFKNEIK